MQKESIFTWEAFLLGGCSILVCMSCWAFAEKSTSVYTMGQFAFFLAFAVNHPHFLSSYILLYGDFRKKVFSQVKYFWAGFIVPLVLFGTIAYGLQNQDSEVMAWVINSMFFFVGWHYIKQVFGCVIVTCARRKMYFNKFERYLLLGNLFTLWALSWTGSQVGGNSYEFYGIKYQGLNLPFWTLSFVRYAVAATGAALIVQGFRKYIYEGKVVNSSALAALLALYVWYLPVFSHPYFAYLIPLFHSLQYLVFVWSFKTNQVSAQIKEYKGTEMRKAWVYKFVGFFAWATVLGALSFEIIPNLLDQNFSFDNTALGNSTFLASFLLFINIHHYFIDNVIWKSQNEEIRSYLFAPTEIEQNFKNNEQRRAA